MVNITFQIPEGLENIKLDPKREQTLINKIRGQYLGELAEQHAITICEKHFNTKFILGSCNNKGFDVVSEDKTIVVEVKQTSNPHNFKKVNLQILSTWPKYGLCTHILILDYYNSPNRCSIIPHDEFFESTFHGATGMWRWDIDYGDRMWGNTRLFKKHEVEL